MVDSLSITQRHAPPPSWLASARETVDRATGEVKLYVHYLNDFRLEYHPAGVLRARGSLPKFIYGTNRETMTRAEIKEAVLRLSEQIGFDPHFAKVFQLDLAATLPVPRPISNYLSVLGSAPRFKRVDYKGETVSYRQGLRWLTFYDKALQSGVEGYLLRFEVKYITKLRKQFGRVLVLVDLYDPTIFPVLVKAWQAAYKIVRKVKRPVLSPVSRPSELRRQFEAIGLQAYGGETRALAQIDAWPIDSRRKSNHRTAIREMADRGTHSQDASIIAELDTAVEQEVARLLAH